MKKLALSLSIALSSVLLLSFTEGVEKLTSSKTHISFYSSTPLEDITASNFKAVSTLDTETGAIVFSVPMQSFEFEKALMQKHYNSPDFLDTQKYPKAKFVGKISNLSAVNFSKPGTYQVEVEGDLTLKETTKNIKEKATIVVGADGLIAANTKFMLTLSDYGVVFESGKPASNIAKTIEVSFEGEYTK